MTSGAEFECWRFCDIETGAVCDGRSNLFHALRKYMVPEMGEMASWMARGCAREGDVWKWHFQPAFDVIMKCQNMMGSGSDATTVDVPQLHPSHRGMGKCDMCKRHRYLSHSLGSHTGLRIGRTCANNLRMAQQRMRIEEQARTTIQEAMQKVTDALADQPSDSMVIEIDGEEEE